MTRQEQHIISLFDSSLKYRDARFHKDGSEEPISLELENGTKVYWREGHLHMVRITHSKSITEVFRIYPNAGTNRYILVNGEKEGCETIFSYNPFEQKE